MIMGETVKFLSFHTTWGNKKNKIQHTPTFFVQPMVIKVAQPPVFSKPEKSQHEEGVAHQ